MAIRNEYLGRGDARMSYEGQNEYEKCYEGKYEYGQNIVVYLKSGLGFALFGFALFALAMLYAVLM